MSLTVKSEAKAFGGTQGFYTHQASTTNCEMEFAVFTPPGQGPFPVLWYLSGLTCSAENVTMKGGFQRLAAALGLMVVCPDTSPRGDAVADDAAWDFGKGAGFYVNATQDPWAPHYQMYDYCVDELPSLIAQHFPADMTRQGITGHSMGGHGALTLWRKNADRYRSVSAFSPIVSPLNCPWGQKALSGYIGADQADWRAYDACALMEDRGAVQGVEILIDQGRDDSFLDAQLKPALFEQACAAVGQRLTLRLQDGYDHSYYFVSTFMEDHLRFHAENLHRSTKG